MWILAGALLSGCAAMSESECRGAGWYQLGERDGNLYGARPRIDLIAYQCAAFGVKAGEADYMAGWRDGYREWVSRVHANDCCAP